MDTRLLSTFTTLAKAGSFTAAAAQLHLAQSTVTVQIRSLEAGTAGAGPPRPPGSSPTS